MILNHRFDLYAVPLDGGKATNLTGGVGDARADRVPPRAARSRGGGGRGGRGGGGGVRRTPATTRTRASISRSRCSLSAYGEWTKKSGYYTLAPGGKPTPLIYDDESDRPGAEGREGRPRDLHASRRSASCRITGCRPRRSRRRRKITDANPFITRVSRGARKVLVDFKNAKGQRLQGTLTLPANYQPGKKYPMLVYFYEILSNTHHTFPMPVYDDRPHFAEYASDGYLVFQPDIVYEIGKPGSSALDCVTSGVKKVIELGYADPKHIGIQGHSWGGYQTSFILTQTNMFAAVVTGAPPTNLVSFYDETYPGTGTLQQGIMEVGQVRMGDEPVGQPRALRGSVADLPRARHQDAVHDSARHRRQRGRLASGTRALRRGATLGQAGDSALVSGRAAPPREEGKPEGLPGAHEAVLRSLPQGTRRRRSG